MIIWRGLGIWVLFIVVGMWVATLLAFGALVEPLYPDAHRWTSSIALFLAALACWPFGEFTRRRQGVVEENDFAPDFGHHSLFFIPVHIWVYVLAAAGIWFCVSEVVA